MPRAKLRLGGVPLVALVTPPLHGGESWVGTTVAAAWSVELRRTEPVLPEDTDVTVAPPGRPARTRRRAQGSGGFASPLPSMLELSAAMRAVAAEPVLRSAVAVLQREACRLTRSHDATVVTFDWAHRMVWTLDGSVISDEVRELVARIAGSGQREVFGHALVEPIGSAPARAVLALRRAATDRFTRDDIALVSALVGGVAATLNRLIGA